MQETSSHFICQCAGRAKLDLFDDRGRRRAVHVDPRVVRYDPAICIHAGEWVRHIENRMKAVHACCGLVCQTQTSLQLINHRGRSTLA